MPANSRILELHGFLPAIPLGFGLSVPTYFVVISIAFCICLFWLVRRCDERKLPRNTALDIALMVMTSGFLGARLFHVVFEEPRFYLDAPLRVLEFWNGGFVWYGGVIGASIGSWALFRRRRLPARAWLDLYAPLLALGYALGRVACLFVGCCYGKVIEVSETFAFRAPTQAFAVLWELGVLLVLLKLEKRSTRTSANKVRLHWLNQPGSLFVVWLLLHGIGRLMMEAFRADPRGPELLSLSVSTWVSVLILTLAATAIAKLDRR